MPDRLGSQIVESHSVSLVEVLDRVLDKGIVVAGDIRVSLANVELLTVQIRLLVCSIDKAEQIGMSWWRDDKFLAADAFERRIGDLEKRMSKITPRARPAGATTTARRANGSRR